jgi:hypothetical protein
MSLGSGSPQTAFGEQIAKAGLSIKNVNRIRRLGYERIQSEDIRTALADLSTKTSFSNVILMVGWALISDARSTDHCGLWPTSAFRRGFIVFKESVGKNADIRGLAEQLIREGQYPNLLSLSLSCPEIINEPIRGAIETAHNADAYSALGLYDRAGVESHFRSSQLVGSYLGRYKEPPTALPDKPGLTQVLYEILAKEHLGFRSRGMYSMSKDELYAAARDYDHDNIFRNSVHIGWTAMPSASLRLSIELFKSKFHDILHQTASLLADLVSRGYQVSAKFTSSDFRSLRDSTDQRICIYVPTCALSPTMSAFEEAGFGNGELMHAERASDTMRSIFLFDKAGHVGAEMLTIPATSVLLSNCNILKTSSQGATSFAQGHEAVKSISATMPHQVLTLNIEYDHEYDTINLEGEGELCLFPRPEKNEKS